MRLAQMRPMTRRGWFFGLAIVVVALALRWAWAVQPRTVRWDEADYVTLGHNLLRGAGYQLFGTPELIWPPLAPLLSAAAQAAGVPAESSLIAWHVVLGALLCGLLFGLVLDVTEDARVAAVAGLTAAVAPALAAWPLYWGSVTESLFAAFLVGGLWATWRMLTRGTIWAGLAAGLALAAAYLTRPEGLLWWGLFLIGGTVFSLRRHRGGRAVGTYVLAFVIVAAPYWVFLHRHTGRPMLSGKAGLTVMLGMQITEVGSALGNDYGAMLDSTGQEVLWLSPESQDIGLFDLWRADPRSMLRRLMVNLRKIPAVFLDPLLGLPLVALVALGLWARPWDRARSRQEAFWWAALTPLGIVPLFYVQARLMAPAVPLLLAWAARGSWVMAEWGAGTLGGKRQRRARRWTALILLALVGGGLAGQLQAVRAGLASQTPAHEAAGIWLAYNSRGDEAIMTRNTEIALYADRRPVPLPDAPWEAVLAYAGARAARYLVVDDWELKTLRPQLDFLLTPELAPKPLVHLATFADERRVTLIYRIGE